MRYSYFLFLSSLLIYGCTKHLSSLNHDPKSTSTAPPSKTLFTAGEKGLADAYTTSSWSVAPFRVLAQSWTQNSYNNESLYNFAYNNSPAGWWNAIFENALHNLEQAKTLIETDITDTVIRNNDLFVTDILEVYAFHLLVNTYGDIPYTEALSRTIPFPKYDNAKDVEYDLINRIDNALAGLNPSEGSFGEADQIYSGDVNKWKKFAATLKLKLSLYLADTDPDFANKKAAEAITSGIITSSSDNALFAYDDNSATTSNPIWQDLVQPGNTHYYGPSSFIIKILKELNDPRLPLFFTKDVSGGYSGANPGVGGSASSFSSFSAQWLSPTLPADLLDYSEAEFLLAEAAERGVSGASSPQSHYNEAIKASIIFWGGNESAANNYLNQASVAYSSATGSWKQKIGYQKWLAFANRNWDAWTEIRRLGYPDINTVSPPQGASGLLPLRFYYPPSEQTSNAVHWKEAVSDLPGGQDVVSAKLFWMK